MDNARGQAISGWPDALAYICGVRIACDPRVRGKLAPSVAMLALSVAVASGCGSGGEGSAATQAESSSASTTTAGAGHESGKRGGASSDGKVAGVKTGDSSRRKEDGASASPAADSTHTAGPQARGKGNHVARSNSGRCPSGVSRADCEAIAEQRVGDSPSSTVSSPEDCVKAIGRQQCEQLLEREAASKGGGASIDVNACLRNPTPHCEEVLRQFLEAQRPATREAGH